MGFRSSTLKSAAKSGLAVLLIAEAACTPHRFPATTLNRMFVSVTVPSDPAQPVTFRLGGAAYNDPDAFRAAVANEIAASIDRIRPQQAAPGSLRLILPIRLPPPVTPAPQNPEGTAQAQETLLAYQRDTDASRVVALRKAGLFTTIDVSTGNVAVADNEGRDFVLWFSGAQWHLRHGVHDDTIDINDATDLVIWSGIVGNATRSPQQLARLGMSVHFTGTINDLPRYHFDGADYFSAAELAPAMSSAWMAAAEQVTAAARPIGGTIQVVLPPDERGIFAPNKMMTGARGEDVRAADAASYGALNAAYVEALKRSHLFERVDVVTQDVADVPLGPHHVTLWRPSTSPYQWVFRIAGQEDAHTMSVPVSERLPQQWVESLGRQLRGEPGLTDISRPGTPPAIETEYLQTPTYPLPLGALQGATLPAKPSRPAKAVPPRPAPLPPVAPLAAPPAMPVQGASPPRIPATSVPATDMPPTSTGGYSSTLMDSGIIPPSTQSLIDQMSK